MRLSNCIFYAYALAWRRRHVSKRTPGARTYWPVWRWSDWGPFPHVLYMERSRHGRVWVVSYKPTSPKKRFLPPPLFKGKVIFGDKQTQ